MSTHFVQVITACTPVIKVMFLILMIITLFFFCLLLLYSLGIFIRFIDKCIGSFQDDNSCLQCLSVSKSYMTCAHFFSTLTYFLVYPDVMIPKVRINKTLFLDQFRDG